MEIRAVGVDEFRRHRKIALAGVRDRSAQAAVIVVFDIGVAAAEVKAALVLFQKILLTTLHLPEPPQLRPPECTGFGVVFWVTVLSNMPATLPLLAPTFPAPSPESALLPAIR